MRDFVRDFDTSRAATAGIFPTHRLPISNIADGARRPIAKFKEDILRMEEALCDMAAKLGNIIDDFDDMATENAEWSDWGKGDSGRIAIDWS